MLSHQDLPNSANGKNKNIIRGRLIRNNNQTAYHCLCVNMKCSGRCICIL